MHMVPHRPPDPQLITASPQTKRLADFICIQAAWDARMEELDDAVTSRDASIVWEWTRGVVELFTDLERLAGERVNQLQREDK